MKPPQYYDHERPEILDLVPRQARRILDVGCAAGWLGEQLKRRQGATVHGIEPMNRAAQEAAKRLDHVWAMPVETALGEIPDRSFDCIVMADVLEHLIDPWTVLGQLKRKLASSGSVVACVPNIRNWEVISSLIQGSWRYETEGLLDRTHLRFFTRRSVESLFWTAGFAIADLRVNTLGRRVPTALIDAFRAAGLHVDTLDEEGHVIQYLVVANEAGLSPGSPAVSIVISHLGRSDDTLECLESVLRLTSPRVATIVTGLSDQDSVSAVHGAFPEVPLLETNGALGPGEAKNLGVRHALQRGADYVLTLSADTVADPDLVAALLQAVSLVPTAGILGPKVCYYAQPDRVWTTGYHWDGAGLTFSHLDGQEHGPHSTTVEEVDSLVGCAMLIAKEVFHRVGLFQPDYYRSWDDIDFCTRARQKGFRCVAVRTATARHKVRESPSLEYFDARNRLLWAKRHFSGRGLRSVFRNECQHLARVAFPGGRPRMALSKEVYWSLASATRRVRQPMQRARLQGLIDFTLGRCGDSPPSVKRLEG